jgi:hypothetical protein
LIKGDCFLVLLIICSIVSAICSCCAFLFFRLLLASRLSCSPRAGREARDKRRERQKKSEQVVLFLRGFIKMIHARTSLRLSFKDKRMTRSSRTAFFLFAYAHRSTLDALRVCGLAFLSFQVSGHTRSTRGSGWCLESIPASPRPHVRRLSFSSSRAWHHPPPPPPPSWSGWRGGRAALYALPPARQ